MKIICKAYDDEISDDQYPCSMCYCGANDFQKREGTDDCKNCTWQGCTHPECPITGCNERSEDRCQHKDNLGAECPDDCPLE